jgi:hypothetical protein
MSIDLKVPRYRQPYMECGPTALVEVMEFFDHKKYDVNEIIEETKNTYRNMDWIFAAGISAIKRGFKVKIITISTEIFDPSWAELDNKKLIKKMKKRINFLSRKRNKDSYIIEWNIAPLKRAVKFLEEGGELIFCPVTTQLIKYFLRKKVPVIVPVNENVFYGIRRTVNDEYDDIRGMAGGHIVVISGFKGKEFIITDSERLAEWFKGYKGKVRKEMEFMLNCMSATCPPCLLVVYKQLNKSRFSLFATKLQSLCFHHGF